MFFAKQWGQSIHRKLRTVENWNEIVPIEVLRRIRRMSSRNRNRLLNWPVWN
jgi:hypothetical protein